MQNYIFELAITHIALICAYWAFLRRESQYNLMRFYLLASTIATITIPLFRLPKLFSDPILIAPAQPSGDIQTVSPIIVDANDTSIFTIDNMIYLSLVISSLLLLRLGVKIFNLVILHNSSKRDILNGINVKRVKDLQSSFTFFNWIFIGTIPQGDEENQMAILRHEEAHVKLAHSFDILFLEIFCAFCWWLPSSWYVNKEIKSIHEYQADAYALKSVHPNLYSSTLINSTLLSNGINLASSFQDGLIFKRLKAMKQQPRKIQPWKFATLSTLLAGLFVIFACTEEKLLTIGSQDEVFTIVGAEPTYEGGLDAFYQYIRQEIRYPLEARNAGVEGIVQVEFVVNANGNISNSKVIKGIGSGCDQEALNLIRKASGFIPAEQRGKKISSTMTIPITFELNEDMKNPDNSPQGTVVTGEVQIQKKSLGVYAEHNRRKWTGTVLDADGKPLPGANIIVAGTQRGTISDLDGKFEISTEKGQELYITYVGYSQIELGDNY